MALTFKVSEQYNTARSTRVLGTLVFSGNYTTGGDTLNLGVISADSFGKLLKVASAPIFGSVVGQGLYTYQWLVGTTLNNGKVKVITAGAEIAAGAYPSGVTSDVVTFEFEFTASLNSQSSWSKLYCP